MFLKGYIVEFLDSDELRLGYVRTQERDRLRVVDPKGRNLTVGTDRVVVAHGAGLEADFPAMARELGARVNARQADLDVELLWQALGGVEREFLPSELAELFFAESPPDAVSAVFRALYGDTLYFKRKGVNFISRSPDQVEVERRRRDRQQEREDSRDRLKALVARLLRNKSAEFEAEFSSVLDRMHDWLRRPTADEIGAILEERVGAAAPEAVYDILVRAGRIPAEHDRFLAMAGIDPRFPAPVIESANTVEAFAAWNGRADFRHLPAVTIDDDDTMEIDDGLTFEELADGFAVGVHIANMAAFVQRGSPLDTEAARRALTLYLPAATVRMFPERLSTDLASLVEGADRPALTVEVRFDRELNRTGYRVTLSAIRVKERLTYEEADRRIAAGDRALATLERLAVRLRDARAAAGAVTFRRPELKVRVRDGAIRLKTIDPNSPSRLVVSELMILANALAAEFAVRHGIAVIFRTQEPRDPPPAGVTPAPPPPLLTSDALAFDRLRKTFKRSRQSLTPGLHSGLGLTAYTQMSSPIRRYADLATQRQLAAFLNGQPPLYTNDELLGVLATAESAEGESRSLEDKANHYWMLEYLAREKKGQTLPATVLDTHGNLELEEFYFRVKAHGVGTPPGQKVNVMIDSIDPARGEARFRLVSTTAAIERPDSTG